MIASYMRGRPKCSAPAATKNGPQSVRTVTAPSAAVRPAGLAARDDRDRGARLPAAAQELAEDLRRLRPRCAECAVDDEERHRMDPELRRGALVLADLGGEAVAGQQLAELVGGQARLDTEALER